MSTGNEKKLIAVIGGTGAQGLPVIDQLLAEGSHSPYTLRILTRDPDSPRARKLSEKGGVELVKGSATSEEDLDKLFRGAYGAFVNTDGFTIGERAEVYWGIRIWEIARFHKIKHYVWGNLDYSLRKTDWANRCGHYDGKGRVATYITAFPSTTEATWSILTSGPYADMLNEALRPLKDADGTYVFAAPLTKQGRVPLIVLEDLGHYARWIFDHPKESSGLDLEIATDEVGWDQLAETFTKVTGKPARFQDLAIEVWVAAAFGDTADNTTGYDTTSPGLTVGENFTGFWNNWRNVAFSRDFAFLDKIHPNRLSLEDWMRKTGYDGEPKVVLKNLEEGRVGKVVK